MEISELDTAIRKCLLSIFEEIALASWRGREREIVSRFCFGHLIHSFDPNRIGMEVAVPQLQLHELQTCDPEARKPKRDVCKDVVIWPSSAMATFDSDWKAIQEPSVVMEWTVLNRSDDNRALAKKQLKHRYDCCWLRKKSGIAAAFVGYAVLVDAAGIQKQLHCTRASAGKENTEWLLLPAR